MNYRNKLYSVKDIAAHWDRSVVTIRWIMRQRQIEAVLHERHNRGLFTRQQLLACRPNPNGGNRKGRK